MTSKKWLNEYDKEYDKQLEEWDLFEFNLFISSIGKERLDEATKKVHELRKKVDSGKTDLTKYEEIAEEF